MKIKFGTGRKCINPMVPISLAGYFNVRMWNHIKDDLEVRVVAFEGKDNTVALLVHYDLVAVPLNFCDMLLEGIKAKGYTQFNRNNVMICATHTHTGPEVRPNKNGLNVDYLPFLLDKTLSAVEDALAKNEEGEVFSSCVQDVRFIFNRRFYLKDGSVLTNPGKLNPQILRPEGDIDQDIPVIAIKVNGQIKLVLSSIVNHSDTIGGTGVSADWPGVLHRIIEGKLGENTMHVPLVGAAGNINHFDVTNTNDQTNYDETIRIGTGYSQSVLKALENLQPVDGDDFKVISSVVESNNHQLSTAEIEEAKAIVEKYKDLDVEKCASLTSEDLAKGEPVVLKYFAQVLLSMVENKEIPIFYLNSFIFGKSAMIASLPCEPFVEIGLILRKEIFANYTCLVTEHGNGTGFAGCAGGYIPNAWNYNRGGYETTPRSNPFSKDTAQRLLAAYRKMANQLN